LRVIGDFELVVIVVEADDDVSSSSRSWVKGHSPRVTRSLSVDPITVVT
jgi:hypothetical protein